MVKLLLRAHEYWRLKRLAVDLVILNDRPPSYGSDLQQSLDAAVRTSQARRDEDGAGRGAVFLLRADLLPSAIRDLLQTAARAVFVARRGTLSDQLARLREPEPVPRQRLQSIANATREVAARTTPPLEFFNGLGGFAADAREYVVILDEGQWTPAPWSNVIANPQFGFLVSADGSGSTWSLNAQQNQLTPWSNDPVSNAPAEAIYIRDEDSGDLWSATPLPIRDPSYTYVVRHGFGYSRFEHTSHGICAGSPAIRAARGVDKDIAPQDRQPVGRDPATLGDPLPGLGAGQPAQQDGAVHRDRNRAEDPGPAGAQSLEHRLSIRESRSWTWRAGSKPAPPIARNSSAATDPWPSRRRCSAPQRLSNRVGGGLDPCGAMQTKITLRPGETTELTFLLGEEASSDAAAALIERYRTIDLDAVLEASDGLLGSNAWGRASQDAGPIHGHPASTAGCCIKRWRAACGRAPRSISRAAPTDFAINCRTSWRCVCRSPQIAREHILRAAGRQFEAGDVQHWWLPTTGQGVKTRVSDDRIWLPFVVGHYLEVTGDFARPG